MNLYIGTWRQIVEPHHPTKDGISVATADQPKVRLIRARRPLPAIQSPIAVSPLSAPCLTFKRPRPITDLGPAAASFYSLLAAPKLRMA